MAATIRRCVQVVTGAVLFVTTLACMLVNKLSLVWLLGGRKLRDIRLETWYAAFAIVLVFPEIVALIKVVWHTSFIKRTFTHKWPSPLAILVGLLVCFAEVTSFLVFTLEVAPRLPVHILLPLLSAVFAVSLCFEQWNDTGNYGERKGSQVNIDGNFTLTQHSDMKQEVNSDQKCINHATWRRIIKTLLGFSGIWCSCAIAAITALTTPLPWLQALCLPSCLCLLSLSWCPRVQMYIIRSSDGSFSGRWKATCLYTVFKIVVLLVGISIVMVIRLREHGILDKYFFYRLWDGFLGCRRPEIMYPLIVHISSGFLGHVLSYISLAFCLPTVGLNIPAFLVTPIAVGTAMYFCLSKHVLLDTLVCYVSGTGIWYACALSGITWLAPFLIRFGSMYKNCGTILKPSEELFIQPSWNSIFFGQYLSLNYCAEGFSNNDHVIDRTPKWKNRVFISTTMYREADFEMGRQLSSLNKISKSSKLKHVYLEAHIFLDNGTKDLHLTDFATQLLSLLSSKMEVTADDADAYQTPYGVQLRWTLPSGMPFFIHLKDAGKVKAKKRWSQVMYMSYIVNFRVLRDFSCDVRMRWNQDKHVDESLLVGYASDREWRKNTVTLENLKGQDSYEPDKNVDDPENILFIQEKRKELKNFFGEDPTIPSPLRHSRTATSISTLMASLGPEVITSSDQGIGTGQSDNVSVVSSCSGKSEDPGSSGTLSSRKSSIKNTDPAGQDYEGDVSSSNENSLSSARAKKLGEKTRAFAEEFEEGEQAKQAEDSVFSPVRPPRQRRENIHTRDQRDRPQRARNKHPSKTRGEKTPTPPIYQDSALTTTAKEEGKSIAVTEAKAGISQAHVTKDSNKSSRTSPCNKFFDRKQIPLDEHTYILATDGDMEFDADSVLNLLNVCNNDRRLGGACGRTHPVSPKTSPLAWYQKFDYAKDFWMIKSAQNVIGSVMCCPGCFSLYRADAVRDVMAQYASPTEKPFDVFIKDTGEDRWMCTLMMLRGWKLEYTSFCDNATYCPATFHEFMKQRRRWVLSDMANMLLVFRNIFQLARNNDSFSIAYILYMIQMFIIVLLSPASTIAILAGGLDVVYKIPFEIMCPALGVMTVLYSVLCLMGSVKFQVRVSLTLTLLMGMAMAMVIGGGSVFIIRDMATGLMSNKVVFQGYYLLVLLIVSLIYAAVIHPRETHILFHGVTYVIGFPAMQILLPVYAMCNIVDQSWGTRDENKSKTPPVSCFAKNRKKYHKTLSRKSQLPEQSADSIVCIENEEAEVQCTVDRFKNMQGGSGQNNEEFLFWERMREEFLGTVVNLGLEGHSLAQRLRRLRNVCLSFLLILNSLWLVLLTALYYNADFNLSKMNTYGLIAGVVYGFVLCIQLFGMTIYRIQSVFTMFGMKVFGKETPVWIYQRNSSCS